MGSAIMNGVTMNGTIMGSTTLDQGDHEQRDYEQHDHEQGVRRGQHHAAIAAKAASKDRALSTLRRAGGSTGGKKRDGRLAWGVCLYTWPRQCCSPRV